jgi:cytochrome c1
MMRVVMLAGILAVSAWAANAQDAPRNHEAGHVYAREGCSPCHAVTAEQASRRTIAIAPDFQTIANTPGMTATALRAVLQTPHPKMPNLILTPDQSSDVVAFLLSLRDRRKPEVKP